MKTLAYYENYCVFMRQKIVVVKKKKKTLKREILKRSCSYSLVPVDER